MQLCTALADYLEAIKAKSCKKRPETLRFLKYLQASRETLHFDSKSQLINSCEMMKEQPRPGEYPMSLSSLDKT